MLYLDLGDAAGIKTEEDAEQRHSLLWAGWKGLAGGGSRAQAPQFVQENTAELVTECKHLHRDKISNGQTAVFWHKNTCWIQERKLKPG